MMNRVNRLNTLLTLPLAATVVLAACTPQQALQQNRVVDIPGAVEQVQKQAVLPVGTFTGLVAAWDGAAFKPVAGAQVTVQGRATAATTDENGIYTFAGLAPGAYTVQVVKDGFETHAGQVSLSPVAGTPRVNVALNKAGFALKQIAPFTATVTGVVKDPRGSALPTATVRIVSNAGAGANKTVTANVNGFYSTTLDNASVSPLSPGQVQVTAFGTTPGGVRVEVSNVAAKNLQSSSLVVDPICDAFTRPTNLTFPTGTFAPMGSNAQLKAETMSTRADEFYIELSSGGQKYAVLADSVQPTAAGPNNTPPQSCIITFRIPFTLPSNTFTAKIVPFGIGTAGVVAGSAFVVSYTVANFDADVTYGVSSFVDATNQVSINADPVFASGETGTYTTTLNNASLDVSQDIRLKGRIPVGSVIGAVKVTTFKNNVQVASVTLPAGNVSQPSQTGDWTITGFNIPSRQGGFDGRAVVEIPFQTSPAAPRGTTIQVTNLAVEMPSATLAKTAVPANSATLTTASIDLTAGGNGIRFVPTGGGNFSKEILQDALNVGGKAIVRLRIEPGANTNALGAIKITDTTASNVVTIASNAVLTGTVTQPASPTAIGLIASDHLDVSVDGGTPIVINLPPDAATLSLSTFLFIASSQLNAQGVTCTRDANGKFAMTRSAQGSNATIRVMNTSTAGILGVLGYTANQLAAGGDGLTTNFSLVVNGGESQIIQAANAWTLQNASSTHNAGGSVTANFTIVPPAANGNAGFADEIVLDYVITRTGGGTAVFNLGGGGAVMGPRMTFFNLLSPYSTVAQDVTIPNTIGQTKVDDATGVVGF